MYILYPIVNIKVFTNFLLPKNFSFLLLFIIILLLLSFGIFNCACSSFPKYNKISSSFVSSVTIISLFKTYTPFKYIFLFILVNKIKLNFNFNNLQNNSLFSSTSIIKLKFIFCLSISIPFFNFLCFFLLFCDFLEE